MKIIGITEIEHSQYNKEKAYVVIISESELKKVADKAGYVDSEKFPVLKVGQDYDIATGYDFRGQLTTAIKAMETAYKEFSKVAPVAAEFAGLVRAKEGGDS